MRGRADGVEQLGVRLVKEYHVSPAEDDAIKALLVATFPQHTELFSRTSFWGTTPDYRLWLEDDAGRLVAHLSLARRTIDVDAVQVVIAGIGGVATHPDRQGTGIGRRLMDELRAVLTTTVPVAFGYLGCYPAVVGFYESVGWHRVRQPARYFQPKDKEWIVDDGPKLILPAREPLSVWPSTGLIDLKGMPW